MHAGGGIPGGGDTIGGGGCRPPAGTIYIYIYIFFFLLQ